MHSAPAVRYPVARSARLGASLLALWSLAGAACMWWALAGAAAAWHLAVAAGIGLFGVLASHAQWRALPVGALRWDGQAWWFQGTGEDERPVTVRMRLDLQGGVLLELAGLARQARWCYLTKAAEPARWADLRRALYGSRALTSAPPQGPAPLP